MITNAPSVSVKPCAVFSGTRMKSPLAMWRAAPPSMPVPVMLLAFTRRPPRSLRIAWVHHALSKAHRKTYETQWEKIRNEHVAHTGLVDPTAQWEEPKPEPAVIVSSIPEG
jgi:hypothetical protein